MLVVQGKDPKKMTSKFDLLEVVKQVPRSEITYPKDTFPGNLGPYEPA